MEVRATASLHSGLARRVAPIACGCALAASAVFVAANDPSGAGSRFPGCVFRDMTGLWCPGCGLTRGTHELLQGHFGAALSYNVFTPLVLTVIVAAWVTWLRVSWGAPRWHLPPLTGRWLTVLVPAVVIAYGVLRNIDVALLRSLAP